LVLEIRSNLTLNEQVLLRNSPHQTRSTVLEMLLDTQAEKAKVKGLRGWKEEQLGSHPSSFGHRVLRWDWAYVHTRNGFPPLNICANYVTRGRGSFQSLGYFQSSEA
jgi:hypothetical protein